MEMGKNGRFKFGQGSACGAHSEPYRQSAGLRRNTNCIPICPSRQKYDPTITLNVQ